MNSHHGVNSNPPNPPATIDIDERLRNEIEGCLAAHMVQASDNGLRWAVDSLVSLITEKENRARVETCYEIVKRHTAIARQNTGHAITPLIAANYAQELKNQAILKSKGKTE